MFEQLRAYPADTPGPRPGDYKFPKPLSGRIINVMTALPTQIVKKATADSTYWSVEAVRGQLALYSLVFFLQQQLEWETHMVGWTGELVDATGRTDLEGDPLYLSDADRLDLEQKMRDAVQSPHVHPVWLLRRDQLRWRRFAENNIWPVFHYLSAEQCEREAEARAWHDYVRFNEAYAQKILAIYEPGDIIWVHDYYLCLLPQLLRMLVPDAIVGLYMHAPFPSLEYFRCLAQRTGLLDGMLGADLVGFQNELFQRHFLSCCTRLFGYDVSATLVFAYGQEIRTLSLPIGIDTKKIEHDAFAASVDEKVRELREIYKDKHIIVGRDRLDSVRGVCQKLKAFDIFLQMHPEWRDKVVLVQVSLPGFLHMAKVEKLVGELVVDINSRHGLLNHTPVLHYQMGINKDEYLALLRVADLCLITSLRDGMNTTSLEFVLCQRDNHLPLVLSEFTGTASVLSSAILVNPWDAVSIANTIHDCLLMDKGKRAALEKALYERVVSNTVQNWTNSFLRSLLAHASSAIHLTPTLNRPHLLSRYQQLKRRLLLFDYDGTLTPIVSDPSAAIPSGRLLEIMEALTADARNQIWIILGRDQAFLEKWWGNRGVGLSAEHGCFMRDVGLTEWFNLADHVDMLWQEKVEEVYKRYTQETPGLMYEKKKVALTWHYRQADAELGLAHAKKLRAELAPLADEYDVEIMEGKANVEVRPRFVNKGEIVRRLVLNAHAAKQTDTVATDTLHNLLPDFVLCLGDDMTDEDMFLLLTQVEQEWDAKRKPKDDVGTHGVFSVLVGPASKPTAASAHLNNPQQVIDTLGLLLGHVLLFESAGLVELDSRGHVAHSELSERSRRIVDELALHAPRAANTQMGQSALQAGVELRPAQAPQA